ncbi:hypothetical protein EDD15DRAFT_2198071 [Pisolithus albus]|nr:hypothetical protein EDD15DRAFT_2198067 [Pisolithus albus]KAI5990491.1 hypothetical protein EDD15DRAFT_2198071 [Pisolithus albus]
MANIIQSVKSSSDWTRNELDTHNISIVPQDSATFFGIDILLLADHYPDLINNLGADEMENIDSFWVTHYMDFAMNLDEPESAVDDFVAQLLCTMGYADRATGRGLHHQQDICPLICGERKHAKSDVCVMDWNSILYLVQENKHYMAKENCAHSQLIAEAITAIQNNN